eukprot:jgi/Hompol1/4015/HPOL_006877-RA
MSIPDYATIDEDFNAVHGHFGRPLDQALEVSPDVHARLYAFLQAAPFVFGMQLPLPATARRTLESVLWFHLSMGSRSALELLVGHQPAVVLPPDAAPDSAAGQQHHAASHAADEPLPIEFQPSQRGKPCGYVFRKGDTIYQCG